MINLARVEALLERQGSGESAADPAALQATIESLVAHPWETAEERDRAQCLILRLTAIRQQALPKPKPVEPDPRAWSRSRRCP